MRGTRGREATARRGRYSLISSGGGAAPVLLPFSDAFGRADGLVGNDWHDASSGPSNCPTVIVSNVAQPQTAGKGNTFLRDIGVTTGYEVTAVFSGPDTYHVVMLSAHLDQSHYVYVAVNNANTYVDVDGTDHIVGGPGNGSGTVRVTVSATGLVSVYWTPFAGSESLMGTYQFSGPEIANLSTYVGCGTYNQRINAFEAQAYDAANLLRNPSFEFDIDGNGLADGWTNYGGTETIEPTVGGGQHGAYSQRITPALGDYGIVHQLVPALPSTQYTLTVDYRIVVRNGGTFENKMEYYGSDGTTLVGYDWNTLSTDDGVYTTDALVRTTPANAAYVQAVFTGGGGCQVDIDFASLVQG